MQLVWQAAVQPLQLEGTQAFSVRVGLGVPFVLAVAYGFFVLFERPFVGRRRTVQRGPELVPAEAAA